MTTFQNPSQSNKWLCTKCNTWCSLQSRVCSWCGATKPGPRAEATTTESASTPPIVRREQESLNKLRNLIAKLSIDKKEELIVHIEKTYKI